jgi:N-acetylneuraminic acid mutarotase
VRQIGLLPSGVTHAGGASLDGALLVIGGRGAGAGTQAQSILAISPAGAVTTAGQLPRATSDLAAVASGEGVLLAGGQGASGVPQDTILKLALTR